MGCSYRKSDPLVLVMKTADHGSALDASNRLNGSPGRCVLTKGQMGASRVVIVDVAGKHMTQVPFPEHDNVVQTLPADRTNQSLRIAILPR